MARISYNVTGQTSANFTVVELNSSTTYRSVYISVNGMTSGNLVRSGNNTSSNTWYVSSLSAGTTYYASFNITSSSGTTASGGTYITTESAPVVGGVGSVSVWNNGAGSIGVSWGYASYATDYRIEVWNSSGSYVVTSTSTSSNSTSFSGLSQGTSYQVKVYGRRSGSSNGSPSWGYITTQTYVVGGVGYVTATPSSNVPSVYLAWSYASYATSYSIYVYKSNGAYVTYASTSSTSISITGLEENTSYYVNVYGTASGYTNGQTSSQSFTTVSFAPAPITGLNVVASTATRGKIDAVWNYANNATGYRWEIYNGNGTTSLVDSGGTTSNSFSYSALAEYRQYTVKVYAQRTGYSNGAPATFLITTRDVTPPVLSSVVGETVGKMYLSFNASDAHSGLRTTSTYYTEISDKNGSSYGQGSYSTNKFRTFTADANGLTFEQDAYYYMRVTAYDNQDNGVVSSVRIQYKIGRPNNWAWHTVKVSGNPISLTASEWNSFCLRINQFRQYRSLSNYNFTTAYSGSVITAGIVNQARSAILEMSPSSSVPISATAGATIVTASYFNTLGISLNSIS